ncbi:MAG: hypothetical protein ACLSHC_05995 [Bilophila wadsworthia]
MAELEMVMGPDIAPLAWPRARNDILIVGGRTILRFRTSFMTGTLSGQRLYAPVFDRVELRLVMGDNSDQCLTSTFHAGPPGSSCPGSWALILR